jgi:cell division protein FtsI (penicillin-binding protein 3)
MAANKKKEILIRAYLGFLFMCLLGFAILGRAFYIQTVQGAYYRSLADSLTIFPKNIAGERGNIYSADGRLLATSIPTFDIRIDFNATYKNPELFKKNVDSVALLLAAMFKDKPKEQYLNELVTERKLKSRYYLLKRNVTYNQLLEMKKWPLFNEGQYKSGMMSTQIDKRLTPFGDLAKRTIGFTNDNDKKVGLEGQYDESLKGTQGQIMVQKIAGGVTIPLDSKEEIAAMPGKDVYTTIDVDLQDVAEDALLRALRHHEAGHGCVILMEVKTGRIKAMANLGLVKDSDYLETFNYAVGEAAEPGSTFKLATVASAMEDGLANTNTKLQVGNGVAQFYDGTITIRDHETPEAPVLTLKRVVEVSSNVGMARLGIQCYAANKEKLYNHLVAFGFSKPIDIELPGAAAPVLQEPQKWSGVSVPFIAHGYGIEVTPLHTLQFYNAIANNGIMVKPYVVEKVKEYNTIIDSSKTVVLNDKLFTPQTTKQLREILEGVVENGTATNLKSEYLHVAGKTGTAVIAQGNKGYKQQIYQASFCGYFPAEDPQYSMIVVVNSPSTNGHYGNVVAGSVFKEVADKVYSLSLKMHPALNQQPLLASTIPAIQKASAGDVSGIYKFFGITTPNTGSNGNWISATTDGKKANVTETEVESGMVPDVKGMSLKDALYLLESMGMKVTFTGKGNVTRQSVDPGTRITKGNTINIQLS